MNSSSGSLRFVQIEPMGFNEGLELFPVLLGFPLPWLVMVILCKGWKSNQRVLCVPKKVCFTKKSSNNVVKQDNPPQKKYDKGGEHVLYLLCGAESSSREYFWCRPLSSWKSLKLGYSKFSERCLGWVGWICWCYCDGNFESMNDSVRNFGWIFFAHNLNWIHHMPAQWQSNELVIYIFPTLG